MSFINRRCYLDLDLSLFDQWYSAVRRDYFSWHATPNTSRHTGPENLDRYHPRLGVPHSQRRTFLFFRDLSLSSSSARLR